MWKDDTLLFYGGICTRNFPQDQRLCLLVDRELLIAAGNCFFPQKKLISRTKYGHFIKMKNNKLRVRLLWPVNFEMLCSSDGISLILSVKIRLKIRFVSWCHSKEWIPVDVSCVAACLSHVYSYFSFNSKQQVQIKFLRRIKSYFRSDASQVAF